MSEPVTISIDGHVAQVTLNRPDKANALNLEMFDALGDTGKELAADRSLRAASDRIRPAHAGDDGRRTAF